MKESEAALCTQICVSIKETISVFFSTKMILLYPMMIFSGLVLSFFAGVFPQLVNKKMKQLDPDVPSFVIDKEVALLMVFFGLSDSISMYYLVGVGIGRLGNIVSKNMNAFFMGISGALFIIASYTFYYFVFINKVDRKSVV